MVKGKEKVVKASRKKGIKNYEKDASGLKGKAIDFVVPSNLLELQQFVRKNNKICIRGGGTGMVGGAVPQNEIVLDMKKLNKVINFDQERMTIEVEAGILLKDLQDYLLSRGFEFPFKVASEQNCTLGGLIATNSVGMRAMKYGKLVEWINWIEVVNPYGETEKKSRVDLSDYAGMEGITGVIYRASLRLIFKKTRTARLVARDYINDIVDIVRELRQNRNVSGIEFLDKRMSEYLLLPFKYHLIIEYESDEGELKNEDYVEAMNLSYLAYNVIMNREKNYRIEDFKVLLERFDKLFTYIESFDVPMFGSISNGILHPCFSSEKQKLIPEIIALVKRLGGNINAGYGVGLVKKEFVDVNDRKLIASVKGRLDPANKFNSGKVL